MPSEAEADPPRRQGAAGRGGGVPLCATGAYYDHPAARWADLVGADGAKWRAW